MMLAWPEPLRFTAPPTGLPSMVNDTVPPLALAPDPVAVTVAVNVTDCPGVDGLLLDASATWVAAAVALTVVVALPVMELVLVSVAVMVWLPVVFSVAL